ncbi:hypothetical protein QCA50_002464 [Cerrena zonata]|uniref:Conserved oligomeric Golgi complex subunit 1 n=1 Tax=Cerrena zonata TaxID=2478898 RepID=A0AAW0GZC9_9APHY
MARRPSTATLSSINSSSSLPKLTQFPSISQSLSQTSKASGSSPTWPPSRTVSGIGRIDATLQQDGSTVDPDELFVRHTVTEVKAIQHKFRNDADAKQQELRLMVGERYRDLLQASTSIISLAKSSDNVLHALDEMRGIASNVRNAQALPRMAPSVSHEDAHLQALQALSAHIKLLLDAPEHLWRLMERKLYLHSAWLFLLCRVVHRALLNDEEEDESSWNSYGLDVEEQFPLIQRQWDVVSQFRTQITHKATLSLREHSFSQSAVCASLLSLHLIESRPLPETLSILLTQRTRTLNSMLAKPHETAVNGDAGPSDPSQRKRPPRLRKAVVRSVQSKLEAVLEIISSTVGVARNLFVGSSGQKPLLADVLSFIQADPVPLTGDLPSDLRLTTPVLLSTLPSSGHFTQLPPNIKSYRPYIDDGVISTLSGDSLSNKLRQWFSKASEDIKQALGKWLSDLHTVTEIWTFRAAILRWSSSADGLEEYEKTSLVTILDETCLKQASAVWKDTLDSATAEFRDLLSRALGELRDSTPTSLLDASPVQYLFQAPSLTSPSQAGFKSSFSQESFSTYRNALKQRISCRTPLLDGVVTSVERSVDLLQRDFEYFSDLSSNVSELFRSEAIAFCDNITTILEQGLKQSSTHVINRKLVSV